MKKLFLFITSNFDKSRINQNLLNGAYNHLFDEIKILNENNLDDYIKPIVENNRQKYGHDGHGWPDRGYGYWIWKPYLILKELEQMNENDILVHLDIHCYLENIEDKFNNIIDNLNHLEKPIMIGWCAEEFTDLNMTSKPLREYIESKLNFNFSEDILKKPQVESGIIFMRKNNFIVNLIKQWYDLMLNGMDYVSDMYNDKKYNHPEFSTNRHDQSVLSLLCKYYNIDVTKEFDWWTFNHFEDKSVVWSDKDPRYKA